MVWPSRRMTPPGEVPGGIGVCGRSHCQPSAISVSRTRASNRRRAFMGGILVSGIALGNGRIKLGAFSDRRSAKMSRHFPVLLLLLVVPLWLAASYGVRFALMEDGQWVGACVEQAARWECQARAGLGWLIHFRVIAGAALGVAVLAFFLPGRI